MLFDLIEALATPAPLAHRRLGCVGDSIRTASRGHRHREAWAPHLGATRAVIRQAIAGCARRDTAVVLGSGALLDVPLADLAGAFRRVVLVDAVHPWPARLQARRHANVALATADLGGAFRLVLGEADDLEPALPPICAAPETDLVVSSNLLSQLPIRPVERLERSRRPLGRWRPEDADAFGRRIVETHLAELGTLTARVCLITDLDETEEDREGRVLERIDLLYGVSLTEAERSWLWQLAPFGESARDRRLVHRVVGFADWKP